ncbi:MAG: DUF1441 family protein [Pyrinomonadaceae bacterium]
MAKETKSTGKVVVIRNKPGPKPGTKYAPRKKKAVDGAPSIDELDELLGIPPTPLVAPEGSDLLIDDVYRGVGITWLANAFKMDRQTVRKRLAHCPALSQDRSSPLFSLRQAASYLIEPKVDIAAYLKSMRPQDLPPLLQDSFWSAQTKRQKWEEGAGNLWPTEDVVAVLGEAARRIRTSVTLWTDNLERIQGLTNEQRTALTAMCDGLLDEIHETLVEMPKKKRTPSQLAQLSDLEATEAGRVEDIHVPTDVS